MGQSHKTFGIPQITAASLYFYLLLLVSNANKRQHAPYLPLASTDSEPYIGHIRCDSRLH